ncbi:type II toxin-antitoxin system VapC family toxin [Rickettsia tamurae]|uniref:PIN domain-containing protein n=1 Tax=Rickettsia tamurae subsp. buchneri TaxID=1462938 RepID=A0A8E0WLY2_9RICK|nr:type II toxin-antitoxin system VapC family toxin [Rickettsia tamurae]KDO03077.1 hypothetical protein REISMN_03575 [Rickettsia tamurae subsp. buchneri]
MIDIEASNQEGLILDTHILIWYVEGIRLSEAQINLIEKIREKNKLYISAISIWEIVMLENKGKIAFSIELNDWIDKLLFIRGLNLIDLSVSILIQSCLYLIMNIKTRKIMYTNYNIRFIIAATRFDQKIIEYANLGYLKIIQAK